MPGGGRTNDVIHPGFDPFRVGRILSLLFRSVGFTYGYSPPSPAGRTKGALPYLPLW